MHHDRNTLVAYRPGTVPFTVRVHCPRVVDEVDDALIFYCNESMVLGAATGLTPARLREVIDGGWKLGLLNVRYDPEQVAAGQALVFIPATHRHVWVRTEWLLPDLGASRKPLDRKPPRVSRIIFTKD